MYDPVQRARERIVDVEVRKLELRQALERARRQPAGSRGHAATRGAAKDIRSQGSGGRP